MALAPGDLPRKAMVQGGYRGYRLAGRWRPSPMGGGFKEIRFGAKKNQPLGTHPGAPGDLLVAGHGETW